MHATCGDQEKAMMTRGSAEQQQADPSANEPQEALNGNYRGRPEPIQAPRPSAVPGWIRRDEGRATPISPVADSPPRSQSSPKSNALSPIRPGHSSGAFIEPPPTGLNRIRAILDSLDTRVTPAFSFEVFPPRSITGLDKLYVGTRLFLESNYWCDFLNELATGMRDLITCPDWNHCLCR